jgi:hypothetical protein
MTGKNIGTLINKLNKSRTDGLIILRPLNDTVDFAKVWSEKPRPNDPIIFPDGPYDFYFIKNDKNEYVAGVLDMVNDLHWYVVNKERRRGHLTRALQEVILPHLLRERKEQRISIDKNQIGERNFKSSQAVAFNVGFKQISEAEYKLSVNDSIKAVSIDGKNTEITEERIQELKRQINFLSRSLWVIQTELEMKTGDKEYIFDLNVLNDELRTHVTEIENFWWSQKSKKKF